MTEEVRPAISESAAKAIELIQGQPLRRQDNELLTVEDGGNLPQGFERSVSKVDIEDLGTERTWQRAEPHY
jgi:hypothetical protein